MCVEIRVKVARRKWRCDEVAEEARVWTVYGGVSRAKYLIQGFAGAINRLWFFEYRIKFAGTNCGCSVSVCVCVWMCFGYGIPSG